MTFNKKIFVSLTLILCLSGTTLHFYSAQASPAYAGLPASGQEVIQLVNQVRAEHGLPAFVPNGALMAAAQAHSEYQASIGQATHTGAGGSSILSRAIAAGYGGGAAVQVTENIYGGGNGSPEQAVNWWKNDSLHLQTLIASYQDAGAGVATANGQTFYTLDVGNVTGAPGSAATQLAYTTESTSPAGGADTGGATAAPVISGVTMTPLPDGSLYHVVQSGETAWSIARLYQVSVLDVLSLNGLNANLYTIYPGQKLKIKAAGSYPTATFGLKNGEGTPVEAGGNDATATPRARTAVALYAPTAKAGEQADKPQGDPDKAAESGGAQENQPAKTAGRSLKATLGFDPMFIVIGLLVVGGAGMWVAGVVLKRRNVEE